MAYSEATWGKPCIHSFQMDLIPKYELIMKHPWAFEESLQYEREIEKNKTKQKKYSIEI